MKLEDHYAALRAIQVRLAAIAEQTKTMAHANLADPSNMDWLNLMNEQDTLLDQLSRLIGQPLEL